ncbi:MAG: RNA methyltransferase [Prevotella sp.]|nr:RNA methyltransferase [Prevotella sp.]
MRKLRTIEMKRLSISEYRDAEKLPLVVVLDNVRSLYNVGSVFRTADAFRLERLCLCGITATPPHNEIHKTALGAEDSVDWQYFPTALEAVEALRDEGYTVFAIEQAEGSLKLGELPPDVQEQIGRGKVAVVLGNEVKGVGQDVVDACDGCIEIRQYGTKHSMNVSVTAGIVIWEINRIIKEMPRMI